jgi:hypothetical protein
MDLAFTFYMIDMTIMLLHWISCHPGYLANSRRGIDLAYQSFDVEMGISLGTRDLKRNYNRLISEASMVPTMQNNLATTMQ